MISPLMLAASKRLPTPLCPRMTARPAEMDKPAREKSRTGLSFVGFDPAATGAAAVTLASSGVSERRS
jgi:hypothetical protein